MKTRVVLFSLALSMALTGCGGKFHARSASMPDSPGTELKFDLGGGGSSSDADFEAGPDHSTDYAVEFPALWDGKHPDSLRWTRATVLAIEEHGEDMLTSMPSDIDSYCPRFRGLQRQEKIAFWVHLISAIAQKESGMDPTKEYREGFENSKQERVMSRGLLQLSLESANHPKYGCGFASEAEIEDPIKNLTCGVRILNHWMRMEPVISRGTEKEWYGASKYWGVLRTSETRSFISTKTSELPICHSVSI